MVLLTDEDKWVYNFVIYTLTNSFAENINQGRQNAIKITLQDNEHVKRGLTSVSTSYLHVSVYWVVTKGSPDSTCFFVRIVCAIIAMSSHDMILN